MENNKENSFLGNNSQLSFVPFGNDTSLGIYKRSLGIETAAPANVLKEKKNDHNKEKSQEQQENVKSEENKSEIKKHHEGLKSFSYGTSNEQDLPKNEFDSLGTSFLIKNDKVAYEDDEEEFKETIKCLDHVNLTQSLMSQWIDFFRTFENRAMKENLKKLNSELSDKRDFWKNYKKKYPQSYFSVYYLVNFVKCQSYLFAEALPKLEKMELFYEKNEKTLDLGPTDIAFLYAELANCYSNLENPKKAEIYFAKANQLIEENDIVKKHVTAYYLSVLGQHFLRYGKSDPALESFKKFLVILENLPEDNVPKPAKNIMLAWCYIDLSDAYISKGDVKEAQNFLELAKVKLSKNKELHFMGKVERNYGQIAYINGKDKLKALKHYDKALEILRDTLPEESCLIKKYIDEKRQICDDV